MEFERTVDPDEFKVGEVMDQSGELGIMVGFREGATWIGYRLHPTTAIELVRSISAWLDNHSG